MRYDGRMLLIAVLVILAVLIGGLGFAAHLLWLAAILAVIIIVAAAIVRRL